MVKKFPHLSNYSPGEPSTHTPIHPPTRPTIIHPHIHPCIHPPIHPSTKPSIHLLTHLSIHPHIHPSIHPYFHLSIHQYKHPPSYLLWVHSVRLTGLKLDMGKNMNILWQHTHTPQCPQLSTQQNDHWELKAVNPDSSSGATPPGESGRRLTSTDGPTGDLHGCPQNTGGEKSRAGPYTVF